MKKIKPIRLKGQKYKQLQKAVIERDQVCQICGRYCVSAPHHIIYRSQGGSDTLDNMVMLCDKAWHIKCGSDEQGCHDKVHAGKINIYGDANDFQISYKVT